MTQAAMWWLRAVEQSSTRPEDRPLAAVRYLAGMLAQAQFAVPVMTILQWPRDMQGQAYLWARAFLDGAEDLPPPNFVVEAARV